MMTTKPTFIEELEELENYLKDSTIKLELKEEILEKISDGSLLTEKNSINYQTSIKCLQKISKDLLLEEEQQFIKEYVSFINTTKKKADYSEYLSYKVSPKQVLLSLLFILHETLAGKKYTDICIRLTKRLYYSDKKRTEAEILKLINKPKGKRENKSTEQQRTLLQGQIRIADDILRIGEQTLNLYKVKDYVTGRQIELTGKFYKEVEKYLTISYKDFPMLTPPKDWLNQGYGGGYQYKLKKSCVNSRPELEIDFQPNSLVIENLNRLQKVKWRVNQEVLKIFLNLYSNYKINLGDDLVSYAERKQLENNEEFIKLFDIEELIKINDNFIDEDLIRNPESSFWYNIRNYLRRKSLIGHFNMSLLKAFSKVDYFYFVHVIDGRGRIYPQGSFTYQSSSLVRSCLEFGEEEEVEIEENWQELCGYGAALYGYKGDSEKFIEENQDKWEKEFDWSFIIKAKEPLLFISFCLEHQKWKKAKKEGEKFVKSRFPVFLDATNNALQHYTALGGITNLAPYVNISNNSSCKDFYQEITERVKEKIVNTFSTRIDLLLRREVKERKFDEITYLKYLIKNKDNFFTRKLLKKSIMSLGYGVTPYGIAEQLLETFKKDINYQHFFMLHLKPEYLMYLAIPLYEILLEEFREIIQIQTVLKSWIQEYVNNSPENFFCWETPTGINIYLFYFKNTQIKIQFRVYNKKVKKFVVALPENKWDLTTTQLSFPPNFIHSLDAVHLNFVIDKLYTSDFKLATIHDSIGVTFKNVKKARLIFKKEFVNLYKKHIDKLLLGLITKNGIKTENKYIVKLWGVNRKLLDWKGLIENQNFIKF